MNHIVVVFLLSNLLLAVKLEGQSGAVSPQGGAGHAARASCVILKRMGPADQVTSHMYSFGFRGKQFQYVEGKLPEGFPFHGRMTDHDVRNLQGRGAEVIVLDAHYTSDDLKQARDDCRGETGKSPNQTEPKSAVSAQPSGASSAAAPSKPEVPAAAGAQVDVSSTPPGADIEIDGKFVGSTPSSISVASGDHDVVVKKSGYTAWQKKVSVSAGHISLSAELVAESK